MLPIVLPIDIAATTWTYKDNKAKGRHATTLSLYRQKAAALLSTIATCADIGIGSRTLSLCRRHVGDWFACRVDSHVPYCLQRRHERHIGAYRLDAGNMPSVSIQRLRTPLRASQGHSHSIRRVILSGNGTICGKPSLKLPERTRLIREAHET